MKSMRNRIKQWVRNRLGNYKVATNIVDNTTPITLEAKKSVAIIGGGIAGLSAAANLSERGFEVSLFERNQYLGGKLGSWTFKSNGKKLQVEHGFHAFFRQYYNLRAFMQRLDVFKNLIPIDDYVILYADGQKQGFAGIDATPGLNIWDLRKKNIIDWKTFINPLSIAYLELLRFDPDKTFEKYDNVSFESFANKTLMTPHLRLVFNSFARAFFSEPEKMSLAELMKGFHFYFLSNEDGLLYDVLNDDFEITFLKPVADYIHSKGGSIYLETEINQITQNEDEKFIVEGKEFDYCVIASDIKHTKKLFETSSLFDKHPAFKKQMSAQNTSDRYAVLRIWTDKFENDKSLPFFLFTDRLECLDSITLYHKMEETSKRWSEENNGGIFELHSYSLPSTLKDDKAIEHQLMEEFFHYFPDLRDLTIKHSFFQHRDDFPAFHVGNYKNRPTVKTPIDNLYFAGDWVKLPTTAMLMEAAYTSGAMAANYIFDKEGLQQNQLQSVSNRGLLA
jgi:isorenieratene synthase